MHIRAKIPDMGVIVNCRTAAVETDGGFTAVFPFMKRFKNLFAASKRVIESKSHGIRLLEKQINFKLPDYLVNFTNILETKYPPKMTTNLSTIFIGSLEIIFTARTGILLIKRPGLKRSSTL